MGDNVTGTAEPGADTRKRALWNVNFLLLWQGQFVSAIGDVVYEIALGFWILAMTGSTALMGTLMAASTIPRVLLSPFAGVVVDRVNRKWIIVGTDAIRGVAVGLVAIAAMTVGMAIGGVLGEFLPLPWIIGGAFALIGIYIFPQLGARGVRNFFAVENPDTADDQTDNPTDDPNGG